MNKSRLTLPPALIMILTFGWIALDCSMARAQQIEGSHKAPSPVAGPIISLPPGQFEPVVAQQTERPKSASAAKRWEYCAITYTTHIDKGFRPYTPVAVIRYFPNATEQVEGTSDEGARANAIAKLGDEGWEMIGVAESVNISQGSGGSTPVLYFKRPK